MVQTFYTGGSSSPSHRHTGTHLSGHGQAKGVKKRLACCRCQDLIPGSNGYIQPKEHASELPEQM
jgi:hypothetical protein